MTNDVSVNVPVSKIWVQCKLCHAQSLRHPWDVGVYVLQELREFLRQIGALLLHVEHAACCPLPLDDVQELPEPHLPFLRHHEPSLVHGISITIGGHCHTHALLSDLLSASLNTSTLVLEQLVKPPKEFHRRVKCQLLILSQVKTGGFERELIEQSRGQQRKLQRPVLNYTHLSFNKENQSQIQNQISLKSVGLKITSS